MTDRDGSWHRVAPENAWSHGSLCGARHCWGPVSGDQGVPIKSVDPYRCTEIPLLLGDEAEAGDLINPAQLLAEAVVRFAMDGAHG